MFFIVSNSDATVLSCLCTVAWTTLMASHGLHSEGVLKNFLTVFSCHVPRWEVCWITMLEKKLCMTVFSAMYPVASFVGSRGLHRDAIFKKLLHVSRYLACFDLTYILFCSLICSSPIAILLMDFKL